MDEHDKHGSIFLSCLLQTCGVGWILDIDGFAIARYRFAPWVTITAAAAIPCAPEAKVRVQIALRRDMIHDVVEGVVPVALLERVVDPVELTELGIVVLLADHVVACVKVDVRPVRLRVELPVRVCDLCIVMVHEREPVAEVLLLTLCPLLLPTVVRGED